MRKRELKHRGRLGFRAGIETASSSKTLEEVREVDIHVSASGNILVILTVTIIIDSFGVQFVHALLPFGGISPAHQPGLSFHGNPGAVMGLHPHHGDDTVAVKIIVTILICLVIGVIIEGPAIGRV